MALKDRLKKQAVSGGTAPGGGITEFRSGRALSERERTYQEIKHRIHYKLIDRLNLAGLLKIGTDRARQEIHKAVARMIQEEPTPLSRLERETIFEEIENEILGLGPIEPLLKDPEISDIMVNNPHQVYVERAGRIEKTDVVFRDEGHLLQIIDRIVSKVGRRVDEASPMVDARLPDGSRVNAVIPPLAIDGPILSIRRFAVDPLTSDDLVELGSWVPEMVNFLEGIVRVKCNLLVSGGTGSGKTTLLNILSSFVPANERIVTIEDTAELQLQQPHVLRLETRPPNIEGKGEISQRELVRNSLRMRPDRIIVGEVRGSEVLDMLQAMNTGHDGSICTVHANTPRDAIYRLELMVLMAGIQLPIRAIRTLISSALNVVMHLGRFDDGSRKLVRISEIVGLSEDEIVMQDIFAFETTGVSPSGKVLGHFKSTGIKPQFLDRLQKAEFPIDPDLFDGRQL